LLKDFNFPEVKKLFDAFSDEMRNSFNHPKWSIIRNIISNDNTKKIDYCIVGAQKAGTTSLHYYLKQHKNICVSPLKKELHYFEVAHKINSEWYNRCFFPNEDTRVIGEATPSYMFNQSIPSRLYDYNPQMKLICLLREPVSRMLSQWNMKIQKKFLKDYTFQNIIDDYMTSLTQKSVDFPGFIQRGLYIDQLDQLRLYFPRNQILLIKSEDLKINTQKEVNRVFEFLGLPDQKVHLENKHIRSYKQKLLTDEQESFLKGIFFQSNLRLKTEYNFDTSGW
jgi:hypothetical protein